MTWFKDLFIDEAKPALQYYSGSGESTGGSGGLNFKVVGGTTEPENPSENTIWVNTDIPISSYYFSSTEPVVSAGMVWFRIGTSSITKFNALTNNELVIHPSTATQRIDDEWIYVETKIYQNSTWIDFWLGQLIDGPVMPLTPFGKFELNRVGHEQATSEMSEEKGGLYVYVPKATDSYYKAYLMPAIDVTNYNALTVTWQARGYTNAVGLVKTIASKVGTAQSFVASVTANAKGAYLNEMTTNTIDISALSGEYIFCVTTSSAKPSGWDLVGELLLVKAVLS